MALGLQAEMFSRFISLYAHTARAFSDPGHLLAGIKP
jgi:hypothetical protein